MADQTPTDDRTHRVRPARAADLAVIADIENSGVPQFRELFGEAIVPALVAPAASGQDRAGHPGFLLVAEDDGPVGFVHVLDLDGHAHLEQVSVRPEVQGRGIGAALVRAAMDEARGLGYDRMTLCTYQHVPWNGPFYAALGFTETAALAPYERALRDHEIALGLDVNDSRWVMEIALR